jgi:hypothetical protein
MILTMNVRNTSRNLTMNVRDTSRKRAVPAPAALHVAIGALLVSAGCGPFVPNNVGASADRPRTVVEKRDGATLAVEEGFDHALWLEFDRVREPGRSGGYLSHPAGRRAALVIVLPGASTYQYDGPLGIATYAHQQLAAPLRAEGYTTWSLVRRECSSAYGQEDLADVLEALDWLERDGRAWLGVERVYIYGYSTGGTLATLANRQRDFTAAVSIGGLTEPDGLIARRDLYELISRQSPENTGFCHMLTTLREYGPAGSPGWDALDTVEHLDELRNPELFVQGGQDFIYSPDNLLDLRARYEAALAAAADPEGDADPAAGAEPPRLEFLYVPNLNHFDPPRNARVRERVAEFLSRFEPAP